jgi:hypothetical protein
MHNCVALEKRVILALPKLPTATVVFRLETFLDLKGGTSYFSFLSELTSHLVPVHQVAPIV